MVFRREVMAYEPSGYVPMDLNENNVTVMPDGGSPLLFETDVRDITLGYHYRRERIQESDKSHSTLIRGTPRGFAPCTVLR